jgi:hypothetical protein
VLKGFITSTSSPAQATVKPCARVLTSKKVWP